MIRHKITNLIKDKNNSKMNNYGIIHTPAQKGLFLAAVEAKEKRLGIRTMDHREWSIETWIMDHRGESTGIIGHKEHYISCQSKDHLK